jgi:type I restriction enzyme M protein
MARPDIKQDSKTFVSMLRKLGTSAGNGALRAALGWSETRYWKVHAALVEAGRVVKGRGRGGSVALG